jgi:hypothetical protein
VRRSAPFLLCLTLAACSRPAAPPQKAPRVANAFVSARVSLGDTTVSLPKQVQEWVRPDAGRRITAETIFDYMDGAGEMYLAYRFDHLDVFEYKPANESAGTILVELYSMKSSDDAFGLLSTDWTGEPVALGGLVGPVGHALPPHQALYGAGLLRFWSGNLYARVLASRETPASRDAVLAIGRAVAADRRADTPRFLLRLPPSSVGVRRAGEGVGSPIRPGRTCFFRSHLVLNSQYFLASEDILGLGRDVAAATTEYAPTRPSGRPLRLILVDYSRMGAAAAAAALFRRGYLPEAKAGSALPWGAAKTEHGWVAWAVAEPVLAVALDADDRDGALALTEKVARVRQGEQ